jgi:quercetin dioxygenase-like cupin family protein
MDKLIPLAEQPEQVEIHSTDDIYIRQIAVKKALTVIPQHSHAYDHLTMVARGSVKVSMEGGITKDYVAPTGIMIKAGVKHLFVTLEDDTLLYCVHNLRGEAIVKVLEEHNLVIGD